LRELLKLSEATTALVIDKGGFLITQAGERGYSTSRPLPRWPRELIWPTRPSRICAGGKFQQRLPTGRSQQHADGERGRELPAGHHLPGASRSRGGEVLRARTLGRIAAQFRAAWQRDPDGGVDLSVLNLENTDVVFRKKS